MTSWKIAQLCADAGIAPGSTKGAAQHLRGLASGFAAHGHTVTTYSRRPAEGPYPALLRPIENATVAELRDVDVVYERYSLGHRGGLEVARSLGVPFVLEVNAPLVAEADRYRAGTVAPHDRLAERELIEQADLVITVSSQLAQWAGRWRSGPTVSVVNGFEPTWFAPPRQMAEETTLVFLGHPKPWHGADRLPALLVELASTGFRPPLLIIGGGPGVEPVLGEAERRGCRDQVTVTGPLPPDAASAAIPQNAIGLAPYPLLSDFYFCPLKIVDYLAAGIPVVSTDQGDVRSLVGDAGIVVAPEDMGSLSRAVASLLDDESLRGQLGMAGRRRAHWTLSWTRVAQQTLDSIGALRGLELAV